MPPNFLKRETLSLFNSKGSSITARSAMPPSMDNLAEAEAEAEPWRLHLADSNRFAISRRGEDGSDNMLNMMIILLGLVFFSLVLASLLFLHFRRRRLQRLQRLRTSDLPACDDAKQVQNQNPRGLTIETTHNGRSSIYYIGRDGQPMLQNPDSPPHSPDNVPQIHITFPDEHDEHGGTKSGRVLIVRVGDNATVGLEPMQEEELPAYEKEAKGQFQSIDMDQIGGLKEKDRTILQ